MAETVFAMYGFFLSVAFGARVLLQFRQTGASGIKRPKVVGSVAWWAGLLFVSAFVLGVGSTVLQMTGQSVPLLPEHPLMQVSGFALYLLGLGLVIWSQLAMGNSWRIGVDPSERTRLITTGPFRYARNPIFTGMILTVLGLCLLATNAGSILAFIILVLSLELQVRLIEEPYLTSVHGPTYLDYASRAGRFVPYVGQLRR